MYAHAIQKQQLEPHQRKKNSPVREINQPVYKLYFPKTIA
jgi:hypothetical protein